MKKVVEEKNERIYQVIMGLHVTEKAVSNSDANIHGFKVAIDATKCEIKNAVQLLFDVEVKDVRTLRVKGKTKMFGKRQGSRSNWKKAYVKLVDGQTLNSEMEG